MGVTIQYSGALRDPSDLPLVIDEVIDLCTSLKWRYDYIAPEPDTPVKGVEVYPNGSEPVVLTFLQDGRLCPAGLYFCIKEVEEMGLDGAGEFWLETFMQDAGPEAHIEVIKMLRSLQEKYFDHFQLSDDSGYWETGDEEKCREEFVKEGLHGDLPYHSSLYNDI